MAVEIYSPRELATPGRTEAYERRADNICSIQRAIRQRALEKEIHRAAREKIQEEKELKKLAKRRAREENKRTERIETPKESVCTIDISTCEQNFAKIQEWVEAVIKELPSEISVVRYPHVDEEQKLFILKAKALTHPEVDRIGQEASTKIAALARKKGISVKCTRYIKTKELK